MTSKKKFSCNHRELTTLLDGLKRSGVLVTELAELELCIYADWHKNTGDIIFGAKPIGRKNDDIIFECIYTDEFDAAMNTIQH